jgi:hypothetical protein
VLDAALGGDGYSDVQYAAAALQLLDSPHQSVIQRNMEKLLAAYAEPVAAPETEQQVGFNVLLNLVRANALALRPFSRFAGDTLPMESTDKVPELVTAPTAMHLYCMQQLKEQLQERLDKWEQRQAVGGTWTLSQPMLEAAKLVWLLVMYVFPVCLLAVHLAAGTRDCTRLTQTHGNAAMHLAPLLSKCRHLLRLLPLLKARSCRCAGPEVTCSICGPLVQQPECMHFGLSAPTRGHVLAESGATTAAYLGPACS